MEQLPLAVAAVVGVPAATAGYVVLAERLLETLPAGAAPGALVDELRSSVQNADLSYTLEDLPPLIDESATAAQRLATIIRSMGEFVRHDTGTPASVAVESVLESALTLVWNALKQHATVQREFSPVPSVAGHASELTELFLHLLVNAAQAVDPGTAGVVTVSTELMNGQVVVRIADTGRGIPPDKLARVCDPFYTTREPGQGTGMGLAVCQGIVARHGGSMTIDSEQGKGTTVTVRLPAGNTLEAAA
jgi:signal transduction histidine kinase